MKKTDLDKLQDLLCSFPDDQSNLSHWQRQDYLDLDNLIETIIRRPGQRITKKEATWTNSINRYIQGMT